MADIVTEPELVEMFADLRAGEIGLVRAPGTTAARRTLRRRRTATSITAAVAVLAVAGGVGAVSLLQHTGVAAEQPGKRRNTAQDTFADQSATSVGLGNVAPPTVQGVKGSRRNVSSYQLAAGSYLLSVACTGIGMLSVRVDRAGQGDPIQADAPCDPTTTGATVPVELRRKATVTVSVEPNVVADNQAGYAYVLYDINTPMPAAALREFTRIALAKINAVTPGVPAFSHSAEIGIVDFTSTRKMTPGSYLLRVACSGNGSLLVAVNNPATAGPDQVNEGDLLGFRTVTCSVEPTVQSIPVTLRHGTMAIEVTPSKEATGHAGYAYSLTAS